MRMGPRYQPIFREPEAANPKIVRKITRTHAPPPNPAAGIGPPRAARNRISARRMTPQAINAQGQYIVTASQIEKLGQILLARNSAPITIRISGVTRDIWARRA